MWLLHGMTARSPGILPLPVPEGSRRTHIQSRELRDVMRYRSGLIFVGSSAGLQLDRPAVAVAAPSKQPSVLHAVTKRQGRFGF